MPNSTNTLDDLIRATGGQPSAENVPRDVEVGPAAIDSRRIEPGEVFWAMRGPNYDGADFVDDAFHNGAAGVVAGRAIDVPSGRWAVQVADTAEALQQWAEYRRLHFTGTAVAVTGSVGKTTTRQMIHTVLQTRLTGTASPRNYNNHVGLPLSMFALRADHDYAVLDLRLEDGSGLDVVTALHDSNPDTRIVMLTGFGNIATAVSAVKAGAIDYLPKPVDADVIEKTLLADPDSPPTPPDQPMSANRVRWEHILRVFEQCDRNVSETARRLNMHRRTLQRILNKHAPK